MNGLREVMGQPAGSIVTISPDYIVINDGVSHSAVKEISAVANPDQVWVFHDHDVPTGSPEAAAILKKNLAFADCYGCHYIQAEGIGYQYLLNEVVKTGEIVISGGSHSSIFGAKGVLGINVSIPELARVVETGRFSMVVPECLLVSVRGSLRPGISMMDAALAFLAETPGVEGKMIKFYAPQLNQSEMAVLCSMACITGAYSAVMTIAAPQNQTTAIAFDLGRVEPMIMLPCASRAEQKSAPIKCRKELAGTKLQAGQIGGYTGGTIEELRKAAALIDGRQLGVGFRLSVCPATSKDYLAAMEEGIITKFIDYGAQIQAAGDHSVVTQGAGAMGPKETLLTTGLYTFSGAMGCEDVNIYTASVEAVIAASQTKEI